MENGEIEGAADDGVPVPAPPNGRRYRPVGSSDRAVIQMTSMEPGSSSSTSVAAVSGITPQPPRNLTVDPSLQEDHTVSQGDSKLELFGFDSLVNILGLKSMTGEQIQAPSSPRDGEDVAITIGRPKETGPKFGTMMGMAGVWQSLVLVSFCGACTFLTGISLSAIATNGAMKGGGPYYLIGRALGPEVGVSIGLCFFLGNAVAGSMYVLGAVETFLDAVPSAESVTVVNNTLVNGTATASTATISTPSLHDLQVYGVIVTILLCFIVFGGVKIINKVAPAFLIPVLFSLLCIYLGVFIAPRHNAPKGITGLSITTFKDNWGSEYQRTNNAGVPDPNGSIYWDFNALVGLFFPAVTGIMAGSNRSASLKDTQRSIPIGTLSATLTTTAMYLFSVLLFGALATREELLTDRLLTATVAWPAPAVIYIGIILSTLGAALQSLTGAPRLLAAIANDDILPVLNYFKAGDWGDGFKSAYFQLALRSLRSLGANQVHPKNWYPIPLIFCRPWGKLPENVPCHPKLADFANCMKKKGRGMSIFVSIIDGDYHELAEDAKTACRQLDTYIEYKRCEGVAEIIVAPSMSEGFRSIVQTMGLGNLKPNIIVMRYPEIWRRENLIQIPSTFVSIINDCIIANKAVVIVKGLDEWPNEYQRQYGTIDLYWIVRDGGLMLLLSQLLLTKETFESCKIQVFCIAEEDTDAEELKADVKKFLYDLRMHAEVIVVTMKSWEPHMESSSSGAPQDDSQEAYTSAQRRISTYLSEMKETAQREGHPLMEDGKQVVVNEQKIEKFLYTMFKLNSTILRYSRMAAVVLVSLPPPPLNHPAYFYMEYMDLLVENVPRMLIVRGYRRDVVTFFT
uniref:Cation chloride cotransporter n=1 Tax=Oryza glumipatula TaxID=40148 RepID=A0A0E0ATY3_9ORYZ